MKAPNPPGPEGLSYAYDPRSTRNAAGAHVSRCAARGAVRYAARRARDAHADGGSARPRRALDDRRHRWPFRQRQDDAGPRGVWCDLWAAALAGRFADHRVPGKSAPDAVRGPAE